MNNTSVDTYRFGVLEVFYIPERPPEMPSNFPWPAEVRAAVAAADASWTDLNLALEEWHDVHDALGPNPRSTDRDAEIDAWEHLVAQAATTKDAAADAYAAVGSWLTADPTALASFELTQIDARDRAYQAYSEARGAYNDATYAVGRTYGAIQLWERARYDHDDRPRSFHKEDDILHNQRVVAFWQNLAAGLGEDAPLPGDHVSPGFETGRRKSQFGIRVR